MEAKKDKRPPNLTGAIVILWLQAAGNGFVGAITIASAVSDMEYGRDAGLDLAAGLICVLVVPVLIVGAVGLARRRVRARVPVIVVEGLILVSGLIQLVLTLVAGGSPVGVVGLILAVLVLQGTLSRESDDWLRAGEEPSTAVRDTTRES